MKRINVVIADDHELIRKGLEMMLANEPRINLAGTASNGGKLMELIADVRPDIVITDTKMPALDGKELIPLIRNKYPGMCVVVLTLYDDDLLIRDFMEGKIEGYLIKNMGKEQLVEAIIKIAEGEPYCSPRILEKGKKLLHIKNEEKLTPRELEVLPLVCMSYSMKEIAQALAISVRTAEKFQQSVFRKTTSRNGYEVMKYAIRKGLFNPLLEDEQDG